MMSIPAPMSGAGPRVTACNGILRTHDGSWRVRDDRVFPYSIDAQVVLHEFDNGRLSFDY